MPPGFSFLARLLVLAALGYLAFLAVDRWVPSRHLPWKPVDLTQPPGLATGFQVNRLEAELDDCIAALEQAGVGAVRAEAMDEGAFCRVDNAVRLRSGITPISPQGLRVACPLAAAYVIWDRQVLQPAAREELGAEVTGVSSLGTYACRRMYGREDQRPSEHARANAIDLDGFRLADGRRVSVKDGWNGDPAEARFLRRLRDGGCKVFGTVLSPDYNAEHADHLHLDMGNWAFCPLGPVEAPQLPPPATRETPAEKARPGPKAA